MIAHLPWTAWLLLAASAGLPLALALTFYFSRREKPERDPDGGGER